MEQRGRGVERRGRLRLTDARREERRVAALARRRVVRARSFERLLSFLHLSPHQLINDARLRRRAFAFYKAQRASERRGIEGRRARDAAHDAWLSKDR
jgi:hypothetical protein